jgi:hypothetical protein
MSENINLQRGERSAAIPEPPVKLDKKGRRTQLGDKKGYNGWSIMRVKSRRLMKLFPAGFAKQHFTDKPAIVWWPVLDDLEGCYAAIDAIIDDDLDALDEMTKRFPEHVFGFENMLKGHDRTQEAIERLLLRSVPLPREHRVDIEAVRLLDETIQVVVCCRRGMRTVAEEVIYDSRDDDADESDDGMDDAAIILSTPE